MNDDERLEAIHRLLEGEMNPTSPEAREILATDADRRWIDRLRAVRDQLQRTGRSDAGAEEALTWIETARSDPGQAKSLQSFRAYARSLAPSPRTATRSRPTVAHLVAAAVLLIAAVSFFRSADVAPLEVVLLGEGEGVLLQPLGGSESDYAEFRWELPLPIDGTYRIEIWDALQPPGSGLRVDTLESPRWSPSKEQRTALPKRIHWRVIALDEFDVPTASSRIGVAWVDEG